MSPPSVFFVRADRYKRKKRNGPSPGSPPSNPLPREPLTVEEKLHSLGLALPLPSAPADVYRRARRVGNLVYVAGHTPNIDSRLQPEYVGVVGRDITPELAKKGAELSGLNILAALKAEVGSLDKVKGFVQILGYVRNAPDFGGQPGVINGASELFVALYGEGGLAARMALGANELPEGACVEICAIAEVEPD